MSDQELEQNSGQAPEEFQASETNVPNNQAAEKEIPNPVELENWPIQKIEDWVSSSIQNNEKRQEFVQSLIEGIDAEKIDSWRLSVSQRTLKDSWETNPFNRDYSTRITETENINRQSIIVAPNVMLSYVTKKEISGREHTDRVIGRTGASADVTFLESLSLKIHRALKNELDDEITAKDFDIPLATISQYVGSSYGKRTVEETFISRTINELKDRYEKTGKQVERMK